MFEVEELQHLISGTTQGFDVNDLRSHAAYSGGYTVSSPQVEWLWELLVRLVIKSKSSSSSSSSKSNGSSSNCSSSSSSKRLYKVRDAVGGTSGFGLS
ncbi:hypothetical protein Emag_002769 [Eimeria magna]